MFKYNVSVHEMHVEAGPLFKKHWEELALNKEEIKLSWDLDKAEKLQQAGILHNILVYEDDKLIGYSIILAQPHLHYKEHVFAYVDIIYVLPEYRGKIIGAKLMYEVEKQAKATGASVIVHHAKPFVPAIIKPLEKMGYSLYEQIYGKYLGDK